jgi:pimeloyl-ACP methyl ester carboxylesterase
MRRAGGAALLTLLGMCAAGLIVGCGGGQAASASDPFGGGPFAYNRRAPLHARAVTVPTLSTNAVKVQAVTYTTFDGTRVPALFAIPQKVPPRGCLIYQGGIGQVMGASAPLWSGAAALGFASFTIDPRDTGARASAAEPLTEVILSPTAIRATVTDTVIDLRRGLDYLERRPECRGNIGYLGTSFGGILGALLAGDDPRVRAVVLTSIGATWREALTASNKLLPGVTSSPAALASALRALDPFDPATWVARIAPRPLMLINGTQDPYVPTADASVLAGAAGEPKVVLNFDGGHNPFTGPHAKSVADRVARFFTKNLLGGSPRRVAARPHDRAPSRHTPKRRTRRPPR